jgi:hypothetical protein
METEQTILAALRRCFPEREYAVIPQVRNAAGFSATRTADVIVMSLWPSRGLILTGFEIKVSRSDWVKEKITPEKAEAIAKYCDRWILAVSDPNIVREGELPANWGLWHVADGSAKELVKAKPLDPVPMTRSFLAAILKRAVEYSVQPEEMQNFGAAEYQRGKTEGEQRSKHAYENFDRKAREYGELKQAIEESLGIRFWSTADIKEAGKGFREWRDLIKHGNSADVLNSADVCVRQFENILADLKRSVEKARATIAPFSRWGLSHGN